MRGNIIRWRAYHAGLIAGALALTPLLFSCTEDMESGVVENHQQQISFSISGLEANSSASTRADASESTDSTIKMDAAEGEQPLYLHVSQSKDFSAIKGSSSAVTRGEPISSVGDGQVAIYGYRYSGSWSESLTPNFFQNDSLLTDFQESVVTSYPWPGKDSLKFFAIPKWVYDAGATRTLTGSPSITYTVPEASADQPDIILASNRVSGDYYNTIPLSFKHIMTGVVIKLAADFPATAVSSIKFTGVKNAGTYSMADSTWTLESSTDDFTASGVDTVTVTSGAVNTIVGGANTFMLLPQTLPSDATLEITYTESGSSVTRRAVIGGTSWPMGTIVTYTLSKSDLEFTFVVTGPDDYTYAGGTDTCTVTSYSTSTSSGSSAVGWTAKFVDDEGNEIDQPDWLTEFTLSGDGSTTAVNYDATVARQDDSTMLNYHDSVLQHSALKGQETPWDLSTNAEYSSSNGPENTANCYLVNAPGTYCLPLVYGNGIKSGNTYSEAYITNKSLWRSLLNLRDYKGAKISDPYIYNAYTPASASLVWEDVKGLISDVSLYANSTYIKFTVSSANIAQGNAVIAVKDSDGTIMWSWHIWVTDYVLGTGDVTVRSSVHTSNTYSVMPVNIGWVDGDTTYFASRSVKVKFTQNLTGNTQTITINQAAATMYTKGNCPYYQWGRKDPMLPTVGHATVNSVIVRWANNKTWYDADGNSSTVLATASWDEISNVDAGTKIAQNNFVDSTWCIPQGIRHPNTFCTSSMMDGYFQNLWAIDQNDVFGDNDDKSTSVKSIYDPCPVGYKVPVTDAFKGFTKTGSNASAGDSDNNATMDRDNEGWIVTGVDGTFFLPNEGYRGTTASSSAQPGDAVTVGVYGYYWYAMASSFHEGYYLHPYFIYDPVTGIQDGRGRMGILFESNTSGKAMGTSIRAIAE